MKKKTKKKIFKPKVGEFAFAVAISSSTGFSEVDEVVIERHDIKNGNYFKTRELAESALKIVIATLKACDHGTE